MGRKPVIRENYRGDAITIHRIMLAIEQDPDANEAWRGKIVPLLRDSVTLLLDKDAKNQPTPLSRVLAHEAKAPPTVLGPKPQYRLKRG